MKIDRKTEELMTLKIQMRILQLGAYTVESLTNDIMKIVKDCIDGEPERIVKPSHSCGNCDPCYDCPVKIACRDVGEK